MVAHPEEFMQVSVIEVNHTAPNGPDCSYFGLTFIQVPRHIVVDRLRTAPDEQMIRNRYAISNVEEYKSPLNNTSNFTMLDRIYQKYLICDNFLKGMSIEQSDMFTGQERDLIFTTQSVIAVLYAYTSFLTHIPRVSLNFRSTKTQALPNIVPYNSLTILSHRYANISSAEVEESVNVNCIKRWLYQNGHLVITSSFHARRFLQYNAPYMFDLTESLKSSSGTFEWNFYEYLYLDNSLVFSNAHTLGLMEYENMLYCALSSADGKTLHGMISKTESKSIAIVLDPGDSNLKYMPKPYYIRLYILEYLKQPLFLSNSFGRFFVPSYLSFTDKPSHEERKQGCFEFTFRMESDTHIAMEHMVEQMYDHGKPCKFYVLHAENTCSPRPWDTNPYVNITSGLILKQHLMLCHTVSVPLRTTFKFYFFAMVSIYYQYTIQIRKQHGCSSSHVSLNITNIYGHGHKVFFQNITKNTLLLGPLHIKDESWRRVRSFNRSIQYEWFGRGRSCTLSLEVKTSSPVTSKITQFRNGMIYKTREHYMIKTGKNNRSYTWYDAQEMCAAKYGSTALVYFSSNEAKQVARYLFRKKHASKPSVVFTGWQVERKVWMYSLCMYMTQSYYKVR